MNHPLISRDALLGLGMCLVMVGFILRGFASSIRRDLARRNQHLRDVRKSGEAGLTAEMEKLPGWLEKNLGMLANLVLVAGVVIAVSSYWIA